VRRGDQSSGGPSGPRQGLEHHGAGGVPVKVGAEPGLTGIAAGPFEDTSPYRMAFEGLRNEHGIQASTSRLKASDMPQDRRHAFDPPQALPRRIDAESIRLSVRQSREIPD
jgi:hypothetical protein